MGLVVLSENNKEQPTCLQIRFELKSTQPKRLPAIKLPVNSVSSRFAKEDDTPKQGDSGSEEEIDLKNTASGSTYSVLPPAEWVRSRGVFGCFESACDLATVCARYTTAHSEGTIPKSKEVLYCLRVVVTFRGALVTLLFSRTTREKTATTTWA